MGKGAMAGGQAGRCVQCGSEAIAVRLHAPGGESVQAYCAAHAPLAIVPEDDFEPWRARLERAPDDAEALYATALGWLRRGGHEEAARLLRRLVALAPQSVAAWERLADAEERCGRLEGAIAAQQRALAVMPTSGARHARLGRLYALRGDMEQALGCFEQGAAKDRYAYDCVERAAMLRAARGEFERARDSLLRFLFGQPPTRARALLAEPDAWEASRAAATAHVVPVDVRRPALTSRDFAGPFAFEEAQLRVEGRRVHERAAARYRAWRLLAHVLTRLGEPERAARAAAFAPRELEDLPPVLLAEIADRID